MSGAKIIKPDTGEKKSACEKELSVFKDELAALRYAISHDLRSPIKTINSYLDLVYEDFKSQLPSDAFDYLDRVKNAGFRMDKMLEALLSISKILLADFSPQKININNVVAQIISQLRHRYPGKDIRVEVEQGIEAIGDKDLISLLYEKLLGNAWKFCISKPDPRIDIGTIKKAEQDTVYFVKDNGVGFDMKRSEKLFIPFQRQHSDIEMEGMGTGLATAFRIIARHRGKIWAESEIDNGAKFSFTFGSLANAT